jgi:predicted small secreted protein
MKRFYKFWGIIAIVAVIAIALAGCATTSSIGGTTDTHGLFSKAKIVSEGAQELASYGVILGLVDSGYAAYTTKVQQAEAEGKAVTTVTKAYLGFYTKVTAYVK